MNERDDRRRVLATIAALASAGVVVSLSMPWGLVHVNFDGTPISWLQGVIEDKIYSAWRMHDTWDTAIAAAAIVANVANLRLVLGRRDHVVATATITAVAGLVALAGVVHTMVDPPTPQYVEMLNSFRGNLLPKVDLNPRYGMFVCLGMALTMIAVAAAQMVLRRSRTGPGATSVADASAS